MAADTGITTDYGSARDRFRRAATRLGWALRAYPLAARGPRDEALSIDVAIGAGADARRAVVVSSGIHGVEGFFGSALQCHALERLLDARPPVRCVFVHALNPFGMAWRRRVDEANIDLNRNFLLPGEAFSGAPVGYAEVDALLNPKRAPARFEPFTLKLLASAARRGVRAFTEIVAAGQYAYPQGLFYGGSGPSQTSRILAAELDAWLERAQQVLHLDLHTGLGRWASGKLLVDQPLTPAQRDRLSAWFGPAVVKTPQAKGMSYLARGTLARWCPARCSERDYVCAVAEFGTYPPQRVLAGLRAENQAYHWCDRDDPVAAQARQRLVELFCPRSPRWRARVLATGQQLVLQALRGASR